MKLKKIYIMILLAACMAIVPNIVNASNTATTTDKLGNSFNWSYNLNDSNQIINLKCTNKESIQGNITIPSEINEKKVIAVGSSAFQGAKNITGVTIPNSVKSINPDAFKNCTELTNVNLGNVEYINSNAFVGCTKLKEIVIPATVKDGASDLYYAFDKALTKITLSEGMERVPSRLCAGTGITEITIPNSVKYIDPDAFKNCTELTNVNLGNVEYINSDAFVGCTKLKEIVIPATIKDGASLLYYAFDKALTKITLSEGMERVPSRLCAGTGITEITIPNSVKYIDSDAFKNCTELKKITILDNVTNIAKDAFANHNEDLTIYCYKDSVAAKYAIENNIKYVYLDRQSNNNENTTGNNSSNNNADNNTGAGNLASSDKTTANAKLPNAGKGIAIFGTIALIIVLGVVGAAKYFKYKDIK